jgi:uncharacterized protein YecE (DUF72 family)
VFSGVVLRPWMPLSRHSLEPQQAKLERNLETFLIQFGETFDCTRPAAKWFFDPCAVANRLITARSPAWFRSGTALFMV